MTPPYRMLDDATGDVAVGPNGERWEGIDVPPGHKMELFDTTDNCRTLAPRVPFRDRTTR